MITTQDLHHHLKFKSTEAIYLKQTHPPSPSVYFTLFFLCNLFQIFGRPNGCHLCAFESSNRKFCNKSEGDSSRQANDGTVLFASLDIAYNKH